MYSDCSNLFTSVSVSSINCPISGKLPPTSPPPTTTTPQSTYIKYNNHQLMFIIWCLMLIISSTIVDSTSVSGHQITTTNRNDNNEKQQLQQQQQQQEKPELISYILDKRAINGFLPMRGRKSESSSINDINNDLMDSSFMLDNNNNNNNGQEIMSVNNGDNELELLDLIEKRSRINSFMPMRGRKSSMDYGAVAGVGLGSGTGVESMMAIPTRYLPESVPSAYRFGYLPTQSRFYQPMFVRGTGMGGAGNGGGGGSMEGGSLGSSSYQSHKRGKGLGFFSSRG